MAGVEQEAQEGLAVERAEQREPLAAATTQLNPPEARAIRLAILLPNLPAARGKIASIPQARELDLGTPVPASADRAARAVQPDSDSIAGCGRPWLVERRLGGGGIAAG